MNAPPRLIFAGDRAIAVSVLRYLKRRKATPVALLLSEPGRASHADRLRALCPGLGPESIFQGSAFRSAAAVKYLKELNPDYLICVHFPYIFPPEVLAVPRCGALNLHPAFLPWNRGWHTPTWAIWERTPYGATLHFMNEKVDTGDIVHQKRLRIRPDDTADSLYRRVLKVEYAVFKEAWPTLVGGTFTRRPQKPGEGTFHSRDAIGSLQRFDLREATDAGEVIRRLRALTTSQVEEAAYLLTGQKKYPLQILFPERR